MFIFLFICWLPYWFTCIGHFCCVYITYVPVCVSVCVCVPIHMHHSICGIYCIYLYMSIYLSLCQSIYLSIFLSGVCIYLCALSKLNMLLLICYSSCVIPNIAASQTSGKPILSDTVSSSSWDSTVRHRLPKKIWITHTYQRWFFDPHLLQVPEWLEGKKSNQITMGCLKGGFQGFPEVQIHTSASQQQT